MENLVIRKAKKRDIESIVELLNSSLFLQTDDEPYSHNYILHTMKDSDNIILVGEIDSTIYSSLIAEICKKKGYAYISNMITHKKYQRNGVSFKIYNYFEELCKHNNIRHISFISKESNETMQVWCDKTGFQKGDLFRYYGKKI